MRRLQARHGLTVDGVVGPSTWALIGVQNAATLTPPASAVALAGLQRQRRQRSGRAPAEAKPKASSRA